MVDKWTKDEVGKWLQSLHLVDYKETFREQEIDGETLLGLTERMVEKLFPLMKSQVMFMKELNKLRNSQNSQSFPEQCEAGLLLEDHTPRSQQEPPAFYMTQPWPAVFSLPTFPPELQAALQRKDPAFKRKDKSHIRALLIQVLFDNVTKHTWYPSHKMYGDVLGV
ncbi:sterile alpha motif domain-containing protein 3-like [Alosa alosa]|nr:sterile alpha motif domain-containing protein 3-like [Alosa alosa]